MEITIPFSSGLELKIDDLAAGGTQYPTARLQKGFILIKDGLELSEEGVGFGVPVLKCGILTIFPGQVNLAAQSNGPVRTVIARFKMNLEEKIARQGNTSLQSPLIYAVKNSLAALIRRIPPLRGLLTFASNMLRRTLKWETTFEEATSYNDVKIGYVFDIPSGVIHVECDTTGLSRAGVTEVVLMNELGAHHFDNYRDSSGALLRKDEIGCWDEVKAECASFISETHGLAFTLQQVDGAKLFRGRELVGSRLAWAGFGYSFPPAIQRIAYDVKIERLS